MGAYVTASQVVRPTVSMNELRIKFWNQVFKNKPVLCVKYVLKKEFASNVGCTHVWAMQGPFASEPGFQSLSACVFSVLIFQDKSHASSRSHYSLL